MESDSSNATSWVKADSIKPWNLHFCFNEIKALASQLQVLFCHLIRSANGLGDSLAKQVVNRVVPWEVLL